ncbi:MAG: rhodanese-like domain-containing protein [Campylobacterota bacterium]|nr:rhodanese-like domain-containing protein [Campylobacterota bacterium]
MHNRFLVSILLIALLGLYGNAAESTLSLNHPTPSVQKLIDKYQLNVVDYNYVNDLVGKKQSAALIIDARPKKKYLISHIPTAILLPLSEFEKNIGKLDGIDKSREIITYCGGYGCTKSPGLAGRLKAMGFTDTKIYLGGMPEWSGKNYVVAETAAVLSAYKKNSALLMDARPYKMYIAGTIPGALSIPDTQTDSLSGRFPIDKTTAIITFCGGYKCAKSYNLAQMLVEEGYKNVKVYAAGMPGWKKAGCETTSRKIVAPPKKSAKKVVLKSGIVAGVDEGTVDGEWFKSQLDKLPAIIQIVDVRPKSDYDVGYLKGSINIYAEDMTAAEFFALLPKDKTIVFSCASGGRALEAWMKLNDAKLDVSRIFYFDANINYEGSECIVEPNEPLGA